MLLAAATLKPDSCFLESTAAAAVQHTCAAVRWPRMTSSGLQGLWWGGGRPSMGQQGGNSMPCFFLPTLSPPLDPNRL